MIRFFERTGCAKLVVDVSSGIVGCKGGFDDRNTTVRLGASRAHNLLTDRVRYDE
jgi:hypothetical protein